MRNVIMKKYESKGAEFGIERKYRFSLWRIWNQPAGLVMFIGLNPSTADESQNDRTIQRVEGIVRHWGYGGFYMMNLFPLVSPYPERLKEFLETPFHDIEDRENDFWIEKISARCCMTVFAWGNFKEAKERAKILEGMFPDAHALYINKNGSPKHPLYCPKITLPVKYKV
jgi:hypothetical protein